jgi:hypothetical protein
MPLNCENVGGVYGETPASVDALAAQSGLDCRYRGEGRDKRWCCDTEKLHTYTDRRCVLQLALPSPGWGLLSGASTGSALGEAPDRGAAHARRAGHRPGDTTTTADRMSFPHARRLIRVRAGTSSASASMTAWRWTALTTGKDTEAIPCTGQTRPAALRRQAANRAADCRHVRRHPAEPSTRTWSASEPHEPAGNIADGQSGTAAMRCQAAACPSWCVLAAAGTQVLPDAPEGIVRCRSGKVLQRAARQGRDVSDHRRIVLTG